MQAADVDSASPQTLEEALCLIDESGLEVMPLAGGQSLMPMLNVRLAALSFEGDLHASADTRLLLAGVLLKRVLAAL